MRRPRKIVEVVWEDSHTGNSGESWSFYNEEVKKVLHQGARCLTVGVVLHETPERLVVAGSMNLDEDGDINQISGPMSIPRSAIRKVRILK